MRALVYSFIFPNRQNCLTEFTELTRTPSRKYIYFWKAMINTAAKRNLVQLCYYITREFSSAFSRINRQTSETSIPTEKCFKLAQKPCGRVVKRKCNLNGINTALLRALSMKTLRLFWGSWIIVTGPLEILNWCSEMLRMSTPEKKLLGCLNLNLMVLEDI